MREKHPNKLRVAPQLKKVQIGIKLPRWLIHWLNGQPQSRAVVIEEALRNKHKLRPPA